MIWPVYVVSFLFQAPCSISTLYLNIPLIIGFNHQFLFFYNPRLMDNAVAAAALCLFWRREFRHPRKSAHTKKRITGISIGNVPFTQVK